MPTHYRARIATICVVAVLLTASAACRKTLVTPAGETVEYDVLSAFIDNKFASRKDVEPIGHGITRIVIFNQTESDQDGQSVRFDGNGQPIPWAQTALSLQNKAPTLQRTTIDSFRELNKQQAPVRRSFHLVFDYELVNSAQLDSIFKHGDWPAYYQRFPGSPGILTFSRVGFSRDGTQALFYLNGRCGGLCGTGMYVVMEKRNGRWMVETEIEMRVS